MQFTQSKKLFLTTTLLTVGMSAHAQTAEQTEIAEVVVSGSHLRVNGFESPTPVTAFDTDLLQNRGATTIHEAVNILPMMRQTLTNTQTQRNNGNGGQNGVDLRGLGTDRNLLLIDGRRVVSGGDLNMIPTPMIERVDIVTGGASAAYGSDAVSGVVNFITKDKMEGIDASAQYRRSTHGDSEEPSFSLVAGTTILDGKGRFIIGGDYSDNGGMKSIYSRKWYSDEVGLITYGSNRGNLPSRALVSNVTYSTQSAGGLVLSGPLKGTAFGPGGTPYQMQYGTVYSNLMVGGTGNYGGNPFGNWVVEAPHKRNTFLGKFTYDINDDLAAYLEYRTGRNAMQGFNTFHQNTGYIISIDNPYIPAATRAAMVANGLTTLNIGRYETSLGGYRSDFRYTTNQQTAGLRGKLGGDWTWDVSYSRGARRAKQDIPTNILEANYLAAAYVVKDASGKPVCGDINTNPNLTAARRLQVTPGCVPFNYFGPDTISDAAKDYISFNSYSDQRENLQDIQASITGTPFNTWAGPVSVAAGLERRIEDLVVGVDAINEAYGENRPTLSNIPSEIPYVERTVKEGYFEAGVPLYKTLNANAAVRLTDYSTSGRVTTWKGGLTFEPVDGLRLRGARSRDIRAPSLVQLFQTTTQGVAASFVNPVTGLSGPLYTQSGGNPNLVPETANSWTGGVVYSPSWFPGFTTSIDYFNVKVKDAIDTVTPANIAEFCARGLQQYCALMGTEPQTGGLLIRSIPANLNELNTSGLDLEFAYNRPVDLFGVSGNFSARLLTTWVNHLTTTDAFGPIDRAGSGGGGGIPEWSGNLNLSYNTEKLNSNVQFRFFNSLLADATLIGPGQSGYDPSLPNSINKNVYPGIVYVDWAESYKIINREDLSFDAFFSINNVTDKKPPYGALIAFVAGGDPYDVIGRVVKVGFRFHY